MSYSELYHYGEDLEKHFIKNDFQYVMASLLTKPQDYVYKLLKISCQVNFQLLAKYILTTFKDIDVTAEKNYCVRTAIINRNCNIVDFLLKNPNVDPYDCKYECIIRLYDTNDEGMLDFIVARRPNLDDKKFWEYKNEFDEFYKSSNSYQDYRFLIGPKFPNDANLLSPTIEIIKTILGKIDFFYI